MSPRPFERPATIALPPTPAEAPADHDRLPAGASLDGLWLPARNAPGDAETSEPRGGAVVAPPHPLMGGRLDSPVVTELALAASDSGYASLRFDWRGVGGSAGTPSGDPEEADADYHAALHFVEESVDGPLLACGYSWGALAAARVGSSSPRVRKLVLVAPPPAMLDGGVLATWGHPLLVIAGDRDDYVPIETLRALLEPVEKARLVVLDGVDHFFMSGLAEVGRGVRDWLS